MARVLFNVLAFQIGWFACVIGGAKGLPWIGVAITGLIVALHLSLSGAPRRDALLLVIVGTIGALWDGLVMRLGFLEYPSGMIVPWLAPVWIIAMWVGFATTLNVSLGWLRGRWYLATLLGAIGGPLAFYAGMKLGGVSFPDTVASLAVVAGGWSLLLPLNSWIALKLNSYGDSEVSGAIPDTLGSARAGEVSP